MEATSWNNNDLEKCLCWDTETDDWCYGDDRCQDYGNSLWPQGIACAFTGIVMISIALAYMIARVLSCLLLPTKLCCRKVNEASGERGAFILRKCMLGVLLLYCVFATPLTVYRSKVSDGVYALNQTLTDGTDEMRSRMQLFTTSSLEMASYLSVTDLVEGPVLKASRDVSRWTDTINKDQKDVTQYHAAVDLAWWCLPVFFFGLFAFCLCNVHRIAPEIFFFFIVIIALCLSTFQAVAAVAGEATVDLCDDFDAVSHQMDLIMQSELQCGSVDGSLGEIPSTVDVLSRVGQERTNTSVADVCGEYFVCDGFTGSSSMAVLRHVVYNQSALADDSGSCSGCTIAACAELCTHGSAAQEASLQTLSLLNNVTSGLGFLVLTGEPLSNCTVYQRMIAESRKPFCEGSESLSTTLRVYGGVAIGCTVMAMLMVLMNALASYVYTRTPHAKYSSLDYEANAPLMRSQPEVNAGPVEPLKPMYGSCEQAEPVRSLPSTPNYSLLDTHEQQKESTPTL